MLAWLSLFSHSAKAKMLWREQTRVPIRSYCPTRWWSKWECTRQILELFPGVDIFLRSNEEFLTTTRSKLLTFLNDPQKRALLKVELAALVDFGLHFVNTTYKLEGDGPLIFECYEAVSALTAAVNLANYPNLDAISKEISGGNVVTEQQLIAYGKACVNPAIQYYQERLEDSMRIPLQAFRAACVFVPFKVQEMNIDTHAVDSLAVFPFFDTVELQCLKTELPNYIAACEDVGTSHDVCTFWKNHENILPHWSAAASKVAVIQPYSAAAERVFSVLNRSFNDTQNGSLQDLVETSVMLQFNKRSV